MISGKKEELVAQTYKLLKTTSPGDIKIRTIAERCHCTTTVIYKHFTDLKQLICFASVRFLEDYIIDVKKIVNSDSDPLVMLRSMWGAFAKYAFRNVEVFELLFWGEFKGQLGDTIFEYYQIVQDKGEWERLDGLFTSVFFNSDIQERNYMIVHRAAVKGYFSYNNDRLFSEMQCDMFHGLLLEYKDKYRDQTKAAEGEKKWMEMLNSLIAAYRIK